MKPLAPRAAVFLLALAGALGTLTPVRAAGIPETAKPSIIVDTRAEPVASGKFEPTWESLHQYQVPAWFRNAKFGVWAHWGPQCQPGEGDWYARGMYQEGSGQYKSHLELYGHPSVAGFKDICNLWKAESWDPDKLVKLYKRAGAQYFFALANHHDNLDLWDSKFQPWNSVNVGPKRDLIAGWAKAAHDNGLPFGVSVHAAHAWSWYEAAQGADKTGNKAGVPYDGKLTRADGKGRWWDGLDPQDLYAQNHVPSPDFQNGGRIHARWNWNNGVSQPDQAYCDKFYNRTVDLINHYHPDLLYFDDTALPLWPVADAGLKIAAHFYNTDMARHGGQLQAVIFGKILDADQRRALVWDIERGVPATGLPFAWQTDTCIGSWHYSRSLYERNGYKSAKTVVQMLADIVSKNGNLLLNIPLRGDGRLRRKGANGARRHRRLDGRKQGSDLRHPSLDDIRRRPRERRRADLRAGLQRGQGHGFTAADVRFTARGDVLYAILMDWPGTDGVNLRALGKASPQLADGRRITSVALLGGAAPLEWSQDEQGLKATLPGKAPCAGPVVLKIVSAPATN